MVRLSPRVDAAPVPGPQLWAGVAAHPDAAGVLTLWKKEDYRSELNMPCNSVKNVKFFANGG